MSTAKTLGSIGYRSLRDIARRLRLGRLRDRGIAAINASPNWIAVPAYRLKDLDTDGRLSPQSVALTFDDGPNPDVTPDLLDLLDEYSTKATFFMCGLAAERFSDLVKDVVSRGHSIGGHSWDHPSSGVRGLSDADWQVQIDQTHELLSELMGSEVNWFRPPRGITDRRTWSALREEGMTTVMWSVDAWDCKHRDPVAIAAGVLDLLQPGGIVLLHDNNANFLYSDERPGLGEVGNQRTTIEATRIILDGIGERGLVPISLMAPPLVPMLEKGRLRPMVRR